MLFIQLDDMNTMTSAQFVVYLTWMFLAAIAPKNNPKVTSSTGQERRFVSANAGDNVTLHCFCEGEATAFFYWYKLTLREKPRLISTFYKSENNFFQFHDEFSNDSRFTLDTEQGKNHLMISNLHISDSATYYCISSYFYTSTFLESIAVGVKDSGLKIHALVQESASESIQSGGSVTLNCTVHTGTCDGEHSVYWFKDSKESPAGLIYTHGGRNDRCERKPNTQSHTCVYDLRINNLNASHAGTYYCAVASCGHILFGNGTKLDVEDKQGSLVLVYFLSAALTVTTIISVLSSFLVYKMNKSNSCQSIESKAMVSINLETNQDEDNLQYAALRKNRMKGQKQRSNTKTECVYSSVKLQN